MSLLVTITLAISTTGIEEIRVFSDCQNGRLSVTRAQENGKKRVDLDLELQQLHILQDGLGVITTVITGTGVLVTKTVYFCKTNLLNGKQVQFYKW